MFMLRGNKLLWDYDPSQDEEIYKAYRAIRNAGVTIFDTADSYGEFFLVKWKSEFVSCNKNLITCELPRNS
jgi:aryl-alcohol dehydrogenase-like predicted oxidoreductase